MKRVLDHATILTGMDGWPDKWRVIPSDVAVGRRLIEVMRPFAAGLMNEGLAAGTVHRHLNSLWLLGGHIVAVSQHDAELRSLSGIEMMLRFVDSEGGPICRHLTTEDEQRRFDSTCRKLYRFLAAGRAP
jgi:hypothetical protein